MGRSLMIETSGCRTATFGSTIGAARRTLLILSPLRLLTATDPAQRRAAKNGGRVRKSARLLCAQMYFCPPLQ